MASAMIESQFPMPPPHESTPWDFSKVFDLVNTLSTPPRLEHTKEEGSRASTSFPIDIPGRKGEEGVTLGDFSKLWDYLGTPHELPPPAVPPLAVTPPDQPAYTSDGAIYTAPSSITQGARWQAEIENGGRLTGAVQDNEATELDVTSLTKHQRKKLRRRQRQEQNDAQKWIKKTASDFESDNEPTRAPAKRASVHSVAAPVSTKDAKRYDLRPRNKAGQAVTDLKDWKPPTFYQAAAELPKPLAAPVRSDKWLWKNTEAMNKAPKENVQKKCSSPASKVLSNDVVTTPHKPSSAAKQAPPISLKEVQIRQANKKAAEMSTPTNFQLNQQLQASLQTGYPQQLPIHVAHYTSPAFNQVVQQPGWLQSGSLGAQPGFPRTPIRQRTNPLVVRDGAERNLALRLRLIHDFGEDKKWLTNPVQLSNHTDATNGGIHVFVDFSNIWIGFMELKKRLEGLHPRQRTPHSNMSFDSLVLMLERGRPVVKRVLAGSSPLLPAFDTARAIGYELNILDKVFKARELTEKQRRRLHQSHNRARSGGEASGGSGPETSDAAAGASPSRAREKWVEQGVDEILHLKMLESIVDASDGQVSTMVLATGDAAEAEYSAGFRKMVERALTKGWRVELVSWRKAISLEYRKAEWERLWAERFRVVELDDYAEFLLDT